MLTPKIKLLSSFAICPSKAYPGDAGFDVFSDSPDTILGPNERHKFALGFAIEIPESFVAMISEKSGMAFNDGIITIGNIIDCNYRGECHAILYNSSRHLVTIKRGQKIAQLLIVPCYTGAAVWVVQDLGDTCRGESGFGSSGLNK